MPKRSEYRQGTPNWVDLQTTDQSAAKKFYIVVRLGLRRQPGPRRRWGLFHGHAERRSRGRHRTDAPGAPEGMPPIWNTYIAVDDVDAVVDKVVPGAGR